MKHLVLTLVSLAIISFSTSAGNGHINKNDDNVAINGYDVVAYHTEYDAKKGSGKYSTTHDGVTYYFSSAENQNLFIQNPEKYLPEFGGYCAYAIAAMEKEVPVNPETFKIVNGKLYLFFNGPYNGENMNTIIPWNEAEVELTQKAEVNWKKMN